MIILLETLAGYVVYKAMEANKLSELDNFFEDLGGAPKAPVPIYNVSKLNDWQHLNSDVDDKAPSMAGGGTNFSTSQIDVLEVTREQEFDVEMPNSNIQKLLANVEARVTKAYSERVKYSPNDAKALLNDLITSDPLGVDGDVSTEVRGAIIIQAHYLLLSVTKNLKHLVPKCRAAYKIHFPELDLILEDDFLFMNVVSTLGERNNAFFVDMSHVLDSELIKKVQNAALYSNGKILTREKIRQIQSQCTAVATKMDFRKYLDDLLTAGMHTFVPNLTALIGVAPGAELIARTGSLAKLALEPVSPDQSPGIEELLKQILMDEKVVKHLANMFPDSEDMTCDEVDEGNMINILVKGIMEAAKLDLYCDGKLMAFDPSRKIELANIFKQDEDDEPKSDGDADAEKNDDFSGKEMFIGDGDVPVERKETENREPTFPIMIHIEIEPEAEGNSEQPNVTFEGDFEEYYEESEDTDYDDDQQNDVDDVVQDGDMAENFEILTENMEEAGSNSDCEEDSANEDEDYDDDDLSMLI